MNARHTREYNRARHLYLFLKERPRALRDEKKIRKRSRFQETFSGSSLKFSSSVRESTRLSSQRQRATFSRGLLLFRARKRLSLQYFPGRTCRMQNSHSLCKSLSSPLRPTRIYTHPRTPTFSPSFRSRVFASRLNREDVNRLDGAVGFNDSIIAR